MVEQRKHIFWIKFEKVNILYALLILLFGHALLYHGQTYYCFYS